MPRLLTGETAPPPPDLDVAINSRELGEAVPFVVALFWQLIRRRFSRIIRLDSGADGLVRSA